MNILNRFLAGNPRRELYKTNTVENPSPWLLATAQAEKFNIPSGGLYENQAGLYQCLSWVHIAVKMVSQSAAVVPLKVKQREKGETFEDIDNHAFEELLSKPNPLQSRFEFLESTFAYRALTGNAYWWLNRKSEDAEPDELWILPPHKVEPVPDERQYLKGYLYDPGNGNRIALEPWEVVHFKQFHPLNPFVGLSPIEAIAVIAMGDIEQQKWNTELFGENNARLPGILAFADPIPDSEWEKIIKDTADKANKRQLMMLRNAGQGGVQWMQAAMSQRDMEFIKGRTFTKQEILDVYAPGLYAMLSETANVANATVAKATFAEFCLWPLLDAAGQKISNDVLPAYGDNLIAEFDDVRVTDRVLELQEQQEYSRTHTINEVRQEKYGDDPLPEDDERGNLFPVQVAAEPVGDGSEPEEQPEQLQEQPQELVSGLFGQGAQVVEEEANEEMKRWKRYEINRLGKKDKREFKCERIPENVQERIRQSLLNVSNIDDIEAAFNSLGATVEPQTTTKDLLQGLHDAVVVLRDSED